MSKRGSQQGKDQGREQAIAAVLPMKRRPRLLAALSVLFALWVGLLLTLYFTTVRPQRGAASPPAGVAE